MWCVRVIKGGLPELQPLLQERFDRLPDRPVWTYIYEAIVECERGRDEIARAALDAALAKGLEHAPRGLGWSSTMIWAADVCEQLGHEAGAARLHEVLSQFAGMMVPHSGPTSGALGRVALTLGRPAEAERHLRDAVELCERMDVRAYLAIARRELGQLLLPAPEGRQLIAAADAAEKELGPLRRRRAARVMRPSG